METSGVERRTLAELVVEDPRRARVFGSFGLDFCCGGKRPLGEVCTERGIDAAKVTEALSKVGASDGDPGRDWSSESVEALVEHLLETHHVYLKEAMPQAEFLATKVARVHGDHHAWLAPLRDAVLAFRAELDAHMMKEERILFPWCLRIARGGGANAGCGPSVSAPIGVMLMEHDAAGDLLREMRKLSSGYSAPEGACNSFRGLMALLREMEEDTHMHIHKENNILFPRVIALESGG